MLLSELLNNTCSIDKGYHELNDINTYIRIRNGGPYRTCRICNPYMRDTQNQIL